MRPDFEIQSVTTRAGGGAGLAQDRIPGPWSETPKVRGIIQDCVCDPSTLPVALQVTTDCYAGTATLFSDLAGETCYDIQYNGQDIEGNLIVGIDFLGPAPARWQMGFDTGEVLFKVSNFDPADPICETPQGNYEGDGCTATVTEA